MENRRISCNELMAWKTSQKDYQLGNNWFTDKHDSNLYFGKIQGGKTISKWRDEILLDWSKRWEWLNE